MGRQYEIKRNQKTALPLHAISAIDSMGCRITHADGLGSRAPSKAQALIDATTDKVSRGGRPAHNDRAVALDKSTRVRGGHGIRVEG